MQTGQTCCHKYVAKLFLSHDCKLVPISCMFLLCDYAWKECNKVVVAVGRCSNGTTINLVPDRILNSL